MFTRNDLKQFEKKGIKEETVKQQIKNFINGFPFINLCRPAIINDGIVKLNIDEIEFYLNKYIQASNISTIKFVPASGAASRMFKFLFEFLTTDYIDEDVYLFVKNIEKFPFYNALKKLFITSKHNFEDLISQNKYSKIIKTLLNEEGLNYGNLPKALIYFHLYNNKPVIAAEEHFIEAAHYLKLTNNETNIHFTVSGEHLSNFQNMVNLKINDYMREFNINYNIDFSLQNEKTDTIAVDLTNKPFRLPDNSILFRPGGHGALLDNLNQLHEDIIFIKNIDNVCSGIYKEISFKWKKVLAGYLMFMREKLFNYLNILEQKKDIAENIDEIIDFANKRLNICLLDDLKSHGIDDKVNILYNWLNRPLRVCGIVKNEGAPGGGPFWIEKKGCITLQIVEESQVNFNIVKQKTIFEKSTHFNPVDIVCSIKDYKGDIFDLSKFTDPETGFISQKSLDGRPLKAQELPGLWNGSMAYWNTIFIEVPIETFNPVKTVNDLLNKGHQE